MYVIDMDERDRVRLVHERPVGAFLSNSNERVLRGGYCIVT